MNAGIGYERKKEMSNRKIPQTDSIDELAQFWQTHEVFDFENELEEVTQPVFRQKDDKALQWDEQIEQDLEAGRLDALLDEVDKEYEALRKK